MAQERYQYGTSPRKMDSDYNKKRGHKENKIKIVKELPRQKIHVSKEQRMKQFKSTIVVGGLFLLLLTISCRNSQIDRKFNYIQEQKKELSTLQKENEQLKVGIENSLNLFNIEKVAKEELGMQKLNSKQTMYISLPKKDYVEAASEKVVIEEKSWWDMLKDKLLNF